MGYVCRMATQQREIDLSFFPSFFLTRILYCLLRPLGLFALAQQWFLADPSDDNHTQNTQQQFYCLEIQDEWSVICLWDKTHSQPLSTSSSIYSIAVSLKKILSISPTNFFLLAWSCQARLKTLSMIVRFSFLFCSFLMPPPIADWTAKFSETINFKSSQFHVHITYLDGGTVKSLSSTTSPNKENFKYLISSNMDLEYCPHPRTCSKTNLCGKNLISTNKFN